MTGLFRHTGLVWEEPCKTYEENRTLVERAGIRLVLDQCLSSLNHYARACADGFAFGCGLKPTVQGGLSAARTARDLCTAAALPMKIDDSWGAAVTTSVISHLAAGMPEELMLATLDMCVYFEGQAAHPGLDAEHYVLRPTSAPGLGG